MHESRHISIALANLVTSLTRTMVRKGLLTSDEAMQMVRESISLGGDDPEKEEIRAVVAHLFPEIDMRSVN